MVDSGKGNFAMDQPEAFLKYIEKRYPVVTMLASQEAIITSTSGGGSNQQKKKKSEFKVALGHLFQEQVRPEHHKPG